MDLLTPRLLPRTLLRTLSRTIPGRPAPHLGGAAIQCPVLLPRPLGHPSRVPRLARPAHPFHISSRTPAPPSRPSPAGLSPSLSPPPPPHTLTRGSRLSPGPGENGPRCRRRLRSGETWYCCLSGSASPSSPASTLEAEGRSGRRRGLRGPSFSRSRGCPLAYLSSTPAARAQRSPRRGSRNPHGSPHRQRQTLPLLQPGPSTPPTSAPPTSHAPKAHIPGEGGCNHRSNSRCPAEPFLRGQGKGERGGGMLNITKNLPAGGLSWAVTERM